MLDEAVDQVENSALGAPMFAPIWSTAKALRIGFLTGLGRTAADIAGEIADGTTKETIRGQWRRHKIVDRRKGTQVPIILGSYDLARLSALAKARGLTPEQWLAKLAQAAIRDDLFDAVVDEVPALPKCGRGGDRHSAAFRKSRSLE